MDGGDSMAEFDRLVGDFVEAGVGIIQFREKHLDDRQLVARARRLWS